jgi:membrane-associated phospholipid phosphatase
MDFSKLIANFFTIFFQPMLIPVYGVLLLADSVYLDMYTDMGKWLILGIAIFFSVCMPAIGVFVLYKMGIVTSAQIAKREERFYPYLFSVISLGILSYVYNLFHVPFFLQHLVYGLLMSVVVVMLVNHWWKISAHMSGIGGLLGAVITLTYYFKDNTMWLYMALFVIAGLVAFSRLKLKAHTIWQVLAGFFVGFLCLGAYPLFILL